MMRLKCCHRMSTRDHRGAGRHGLESYLEWIAESVESASEPTESSQRMASFTSLYIIARGHSRGGATS